MTTGTMRTLRSRLRGRAGWSWAAPLVFALAGLLFVSSAATAGGRDLRGNRTDLADLIRAENRRVETLGRQVDQLRADVDARSRAEDDARVRAARARGDALAGPAGLLPAAGPALRVALDDAPRPVDGRPIPGNPSPDDLVVHQQDVQAVVNALWQGGAEAMQLMDQRVISTSAVRCVGNTLILQGRVYSPPYVVTAIGDVPRMRAALDASAAVRIYRDYVDAFGLGWSVESLPHQTLPGYAGALDLQHAAPARPATATASASPTAAPSSGAR